MYSLNLRERKNRTGHAARGPYRLHVGREDFFCRGDGRDLSCGRILLIAAG